MGLRDRRGFQSLEYGMSDEDDNGLEGLSGAAAGGSVNAHSTKHGKRAGRAVS